MSYISDLSKDLSCKSDRNWPFERDSYELLNLIGVGSCSVVYNATCLPLNINCAIKIIKSCYKETSLTPFTALHQYIKNLVKCDHENTVKCFSCFFVNESLWMVSHFSEGGSLLDVIQYKMRVINCKNGVFDEEIIATVLKEVLKGLVYIHSLGEIHRDIKASNILIDDDGVVQIDDFGVLSFVAASRTVLRNRPNSLFIGSPYWMAPEILLNREYDNKVDIWSFGITAIELATGNPPHHNLSLMKAAQSIIENDPPTLETGAEERHQFKTYGHTFRKLIAACLQKSPRKRPSASELLNFRFFKKAKDTKTLMKTVIAIGPSVEARAQMVKLKSSAGPAPLRRDCPADWGWEDEDNTVDSYNDSAYDMTSSSAIRTKENSFENIVGLSSIEICTRGVYSVDLEKLRSILFCLRLRNSYKELIDVNFPYKSGVDTPEGVAIELVNAGLLDPRDVVAVALQMDKLIEKGHGIVPFSSTATFPLISADPHDNYDDKTLVGFAQLTITIDQ